MPAEKAMFVNRTAGLLVDLISKVDGRVGETLQNRMRPGAAFPVYIRMLPKAMYVKSGVYSHPAGGKVLVRTEGLTTTVSANGPHGNVPLFQVITIGENHLLTRTAKGYAVKLGGIETLAHELRHVSRIRPGAVMNELTARQRLLEELEADVFTLKMLRALGAKQRMAAYVEGRPIRALAEMRMKQLKMKRMTTETGARYARVGVRTKKGFLERIFGRSAAEKELRRKSSTLLAKKAHAA